MRTIQTLRRSTPTAIIVAGIISFLLWTGEQLLGTYVVDKLAEWGITTNSIVGLVLSSPVNVFFITFLIVLAISLLKDVFRESTQVTEPSNNSISPITAINDSRNAPIVTAEGQGVASGGDSHVTTTHHHYYGNHPSETNEQVETLTMEDYREEYQPHQVKEGETWESISEREYGSARFVKRIRDANNGRLYLPPKGSYISIPTIHLSSIQRENGKYVSIKVVNGNREKPAFCKAIIVKLDRFKADEWRPISTDESGALSWHHGGSDRDGFKEVFLSPEFINIARLPTRTKEMNLFIRQNIVFTHLVERPHKAGRYRMLIEVQYRFGSKVRTEKWFGYLDAIDMTDSSKHKLTITELEDFNEWK
jgi:hypothetical protein